MTSRKYPAAKNASESIQTVLFNLGNGGGDVRISCSETGGAQQFSRRDQDSVDLPSDALTGKRDSAKTPLSPELFGQVRERFSDVEPAFRATTAYGLDAFTESEAQYLATHRSPESVRSRILAQRDATQQRLDARGTQEGLNRPLSRALPATTSASIANASTPRSVAMVHVMAVFTAVRERLPDRTILYFEKVRTGRKMLALTSMRKYPGATDFKTSQKLRLYLGRLAGELGQSGCLSYDEITELCCEGALTVVDVVVRPGLCRRVFHGQLGQSRSFAFE